MRARPYILPAGLTVLVASAFLPIQALAQTAPAPISSSHALLSAVALVAPGDAASGPSAATSPTNLDPPLVGARDNTQARGPARQAVREAERHYQYGKFCIQEGKKEEARHEFDLALETLMALPQDTPDRAVAEQKFEELIRLIHRQDLDTLDAGAVPEVPSALPGSQLAEIVDLTFPVDPKLKGKVVAQVAANSWQLPLVVNDAVLSYINFFTSQRGRKILYSGLKRSGRYKAMISRILDEEGVPQELIYLAQAESAFVPKAVSRARAAGMWQFVRSSGAEYGLTSGRMTDERLDPEKATRAAAHHLRDLYQQTGDWYLAMAAYNCGPYCVERAVQRTGYADFWELRSRSALPRETAAYVPAILAMAIVARDLRAYGLEEPDRDAPIEYDTLKLAAPTGLALLSDASNVSLAELRDLNPSLLKDVAPSGYEVRVPRGKVSLVMAALDSVPSEKRDAWRLHHVSDGDSLTLIARRYGTLPAAIVSANARLDASFFDAPRAGEVLLIPASARPDTSSARPGTRSTGRRSTYSSHGRARVTSVSAKRTRHKR
jgi:membrane-bound lytic murein transglycosylase D